MSVLLAVAPVDVCSLGHGRVLGHAGGLLRPWCGCGVALFASAGVYLLLTAGLCSVCAFCDYRCPWWVQGPLEFTCRNLTGA